MAVNLRINGDRLWSSIMETARFGGTPKGGIRRLALTKEDAAVRRCTTLPVHQSRRSKTMPKRHVSFSKGLFRRSPHSADAGSLFYRMGTSTDESFRGLHNKRVASQRPYSSAATRFESIFVVTRWCVACPSGDCALSLDRKFRSTVPLGPAAVVLAARPDYMPVAPDSSGIDPLHPQSLPPIDHGPSAPGPATALRRCVPGRCIPHESKKW
jgi:hypothetical protein